MRDCIDNWIKQGGNAARFGGNFLWQIRMENGGHRQVCYKYEAQEKDPVACTDSSALLTGTWESLRINRPGAHTFGANASQGIYAGLGHCAGRGSGGFTIYRPDHWTLTNTGLGFGDVLGSDSRIFGYEVDGLDYTISHGLPTPTGADGASTDITIIGLGLASNIETNQQQWGNEYYIGDEDACWLAKQIYGD